jgi:hypothetical protein
LTLSQTFYFFFGRQSPYGPGTQSGKPSQLTQTFFVVLAVLYVHPLKAIIATAINDPKSNLFITTPYKR